jgi:hypothetical protein
MRKEHTIVPFEGFQDELLIALPIVRLVEAEVMAHGPAAQRRRLQRPEKPDHASQPRAVAHQHHQN